MPVMESMFFYPALFAKSNVMEFLNMEKGTYKNVKNPYSCRENAVVHSFVKKKINKWYPD